MNLRFARREALHFIAVVAILVITLGYLFGSSGAVINTLYYPLANHLNPVPADISVRLLISEVMSNPSGQEPALEWVEIHNRSGQSINLFEYKVGDGETMGDTEGMYQFPAGAVIEPGQVVVMANQGLPFSQIYGYLPDYELTDSHPVISDMIKYRDWSTGSINLNNSGDEILLLDKGNRILDSISWGNSIFAFSPAVSSAKDGQSHERFPANVDRNLAADWIAQSSPQPGSVRISPPTPENSPTPTGIPTYCDSSSLLISEVLYDPSHSTDPIGEWIEIFNWGNAAVYLGCFFIGDEETKGGGEGMYTFPEETSIQSGEVIIVAYQASDFLSQYGFNPSFELAESNPQVPNLIKNKSWASGSIQLSNSGDDVLLMNMEENIVDAVSWGNSEFAFSPSVPLVNPGLSLMRQPADVDSNSAEDWVENSSPNPGRIDFNPPDSSPVSTSTSRPDETRTPVNSSTPRKTPTRTRPPTKTPTKIPTMTKTPTATATLTITPTRTLTTTATPSVEPLPSVVINEIHADPHPSLGDANLDGTVDSADDEFIELVNDSSFPLDVSGWVLRDAMADRHIFPGDSIIRAGCSLVVFSGGDPTGTFGNSSVQLASSGNLGLNDRGDIINLYDSQMELVANLIYGEEAGDDQSITREPDITGGEPLRKHSLAADSNGSLYSPGTKIDGSYFPGCSD